MKARIAKMKYTMIVVGFLLSVVYFAWPTDAADKIKGPKVTDKVGDNVDLAGLHGVQTKACKGAVSHPRISRRISGFVIIPEILLVFSNAKGIHTRSDCDHALFGTPTRILSGEGGATTLQGSNPCENEHLCKRTEMSVPGWDT